MKHPRQHIDKHLEFVRQLPCCICGDNTTTEAAHIRFADLKAGKRNTGMGEKPSDMYVLPLCGKHHRAQHRSSEKGFWEHHEIDPVKVAMALFISTGDHEAGTKICEANAFNK